MSIRKPDRVLIAEVLVLRRQGVLGKCVKVLCDEGLIWATANEKGATENP